MTDGNTDALERIYTNKTGTAIITPPAIPLHPTDIEWVPAANLAEMTRRRDAWQAKAEGYDAVRLALREKVGTPWPPNMSRLLWAGIAADEKKRADDAEADLTEARAALVTARQEALDEADARDIAAMIERKGVEHDRFLEGWGVPPNSVVVFEGGNITKYLPIRALAALEADT